MITDQSLPRHTTSSSQKLIIGYAIIGAMTGVVVLIARQLLWSMNMSKLMILPGLLTITLMIVTGSITGVSLAMPMFSERWRRGLSGAFSGLLITLALISPTTSTATDVLVTFFNPFALILMFLCAIAGTIAGLMCTNRHYSVLSGVLGGVVPAVLALVVITGFSLSSGSPVINIAVFFYLIFLVPTVGAISGGIFSFLFGRISERLGIYVSGLIYLLGNKESRTKDFAASVTIGTALGAALGVVPGTLLSLLMIAD